MGKKKTLDEGFSGGAAETSLHDFAVGEGPPADWTTTAAWQDISTTDWSSIFSSMSLMSSCHQTPEVLGEWSRNRGRPPIASDGTM